MEIIFKSILTISSLIIAVTTILVTIKKFRKWLVSFIAEDIDLNHIDKNSDLYELKSEMNEIRKSLKRIEIMNMLKNDPSNKEVILNLFDEYVEMGGNSYIIHIIDEWKKSF